MNDSNRFELRDRLIRKRINWVKNNCKDSTVGLDIEYGCNLYGFDCHEITSLSNAILKLEDEGYKVIYY